MKCTMTSQQKPAMQANHMNPQELKSILSEGLLSFPLTDFDAAGDFRADTYAKRLVCSLTSSRSANPWTSA